MEINNMQENNNPLQSSRRLWLIRHGATIWNSEQRFCGCSDIPLSDQGREQAAWLADYLHSASIGIIYSSDLLRARQTAEIISHAQSVPIQVSAAWRELDF